MAKPTKDFAEELMRNVPPQEDFKSAITIEDSEPGEVTYRIVVPESQRNYRGTIFGGFISCMMEAAAGMATYAYGVNNVAVSCSSNFIRAVEPQELVVTATTSHKGRSTSVCHTAIHTPEGKLVAESTYTMFLFGPIEG